MIDTPTPGESAMERAERFMQKWKPYVANTPEFTGHLAHAIEEAERRSAERMREAAARVVDRRCWPPFDELQLVLEQAEDAIRALPLVPPTGEKGDQA